MIERVSYSRAKVSAEIEAPKSITEGQDREIDLSLTFKHVTSAATNITISIDKADTTAKGFTIGSYHANYAVSFTSPTDYTVDLPAIFLPDPDDTTGGTLALTVHATGVVFANGTDTEIIKIKVNDDGHHGGGATDQTGTHHDDILTGTDAADHLRGLSGDDRLDGGAGADLLEGGKGDDTYLVDNSGDRLVELAGQGTDTVIASRSWTLGDNLENLALTGSHDRTGTGNDLANVIRGGSGDDELYGRGGNDTLKGGKGDDLLDGGSGDDVIRGGAGRDVMTGGSGHDRFVFETGDFGKVTLTGADRITDFSHNDVIDLSKVNACPGGPDSAFTFVGSDSFDHHMGELRAFVSDGNTYVDGDIDGDGKADFRIQLDGVHHLAAHDFLL